MADVGIIELLLMIAVGIIGWILRRHGQEIKTVVNELNKILDDGVVTRDELERLIKLLSNVNNKK